MSLYPQIENMPFNPERPPGSPVEKQTREAIRFFEVVIIDLAMTSSRAKKAEFEDRRRIPELGQTVGKLWLKCVEGLPTDMQSMSILYFDRRFKDAKKRYCFEGNSLIAGFKGEFATGVLLHQNELEIRYPSSTQDLQRSTDLIAAYPDGKEIHVQAKTLSFPEELSRHNLAEAMPIFSLIRTPQELRQFKDSLYNLPSHEELDQDRIAEIAGAAEVMQEQGVKYGFTPVFCLLGSPESAGSDIFSESARPTELAASQAKIELETIGHQI